MWKVSISCLLFQCQPAVGMQGTVWANRRVADPRRPEQRIAVVSHAGFIRHTLSAFAGSLPPQPAEALEREFLNCELRTVVWACPNSICTLQGTLQWAACGGSRLRRRSASSY